MCHHADAYIENKMVKAKRRYPSSSRAKSRRSFKRDNKFALGIFFLFFVLAVFFVVYVFQIGGFNFREKTNNFSRENIESIIGSDENNYLEFKKQEPLKINQIPTKNDLDKNIQKQSIDAPKYGDEDKVYLDELINKN